MTQAPIPGDSPLHSLASFEVPRVAYQVLDVPSILEQAVRTGLMHGSVAVENTASADTTRITCCVFIVRRLVDGWGDVTKSADRTRDRDLILACATAIESAVAAMDRAAPR